MAVQVGHVRQILGFVWTAMHQQKLMPGPDELPQHGSAEKAGPTDHDDTHQQTFAPASPARRTIAARWAPLLATPKRQCPRGFTRACISAAAASAAAARQPPSEQPAAIGRGLP